EEPDDVADILRIPGMVVPGEAIGLAAAAAEVEAHGADPAGGELAVRVQGVATAGRALEAVQEEDERRVLREARIREVEVHEIAVRRVDPLPAQRDVEPRAK